MITPSLFARNGIHRHRAYEYNRESQSVRHLTAKALRPGQGRPGGWDGISVLTVLQVLFDISRCEAAGLDVKKEAVGLRSAQPIYGYWRRISAAWPRVHSEHIARNYPACFESSSRTAGTNSSGISMTVCVVP